PLTHPAVYSTRIGACNWPVGGNRGTAGRRGPARSSDPSGPPAIGPGRGGRAAGSGPVGRPVRAAGDRPATGGADGKPGGRGSRRRRPEGAGSDRCGGGRGMATIRDKMGHCLHGVFTSLVGLSSPSV